MTKCLQMNRVWPYPHRNSDAHPRGTKRTRPPNERGEKPLASDQSDQDDESIPLSKRINRLNIEYHSSTSSRATAKDNPPDQLQQHPDGHRHEEEEETFKEKYPYHANSTYYRTNELLYSLHEERTQRNQQAALHKALNSHLKLWYHVYIFNWERVQNLSSFHR